MGIWAGGSDPGWHALLCSRDWSREAVVDGHFPAIV